MKLFNKTLSILWLLVLVISQDVLSQSDENYVSEHTFRYETTTKPSNEFASTKEQVSTKVTYLDDLGRPVQIIQKNGSPAGKDVVNLQTYDEYGRGDKIYLPVPTSVTDGRIHSNSSIIATGTNYYNNKLGTQDGSWAFSQSIYESSPLNRVVSSQSPGTSWVGSQRGVTSEYEVNIASDNVYNWIIDESDNSVSVGTGTYFSTGRLNKVIKVNENGQKNIEFTNYKGQVVLSRAFLDKKHVDTYYIFDKYGQQRIVIQPEGSEYINNNGYAALNTEDFRHKYVFEYQYDDLKRMVGKRIPGSDWVYMVYDNRNRVVLTQTGNQRNVQVVTSNSEVSEYLGNSYDIQSGSLTLKPGFRFTASGSSAFEASTLEAPSEVWQFTKYDQFNRAIITGQVKLSGSVSEIQVDVDDFYANNNPTYETYLLVSGSLFGYSNNSFPKTHENGATVTTSDLLTVSYFDSYQFNGANGAPLGYLDTPKGHATGVRTRVLGTDQWLETATYYDYKYREIKSISENHKNGTDILANQYENEILSLINQTVTTHTSDDYTGELKEIQTFDYDHIGNIEEVKHKINSGDEITLSKNTYNEIGETQRKQLHSVGGSSFIQSLDYQYNIRGWVSAINDISNLGSSDKFGMKLDYENAGQYNGNIGRITWKTMGGSLNQNEQEYAYAYDDLNRLKKATYSSYGAANHFTVGGDDAGQIEYDLNGNIMSLNRNFNGTTADNLNYYYSGNQLLEVTDSATATLFRDKTPATGENDYKYDANGNMVSDLNKEIAQISYNHLNLVELVIFENGDYVKYFYDGSGKKLQKESKTGTSTKVKDYISGKHYEDGTLTFFHHGDGRVRLANNTFHYEYNLEDHLENARVTIDSTGNVIQRDDYFPFGLTFNHYAQSPENLYKFTGKEEQEETNWTDFGARMYMADIGRWGVIDPEAKLYDQWSPYNYVKNNPLIYIDPDGRKLKFVGTRKFRKETRRIYRNLAKMSPSFAAVRNQLKKSKNKHVVFEVSDDASKRGKRLINKFAKLHMKGKVGIREMLEARNDVENAAVLNDSEKFAGINGGVDDGKASMGPLYGTGSTFYFPRSKFDSNPESSNAITSSLYAVIAHETSHQLDADNGTSEPASADKYPDEKEAVKFEDIVTQEINIYFKMNGRTKQYKLRKKYK
ncbi:MAG: RHS repeat-associated core domain-containing protein [bacterium]|nr:RHS repeat-associated core domain-containing protein [bacterium]